MRRAPDARGDPAGDRRRLAERCGNQPGLCRQLHAPQFYFKLNRAEIGAFLSHRAAWRRIVEEGLDYAIVFEDDASIDPVLFARACAFARATRTQWDYVLSPAMKRADAEGCPSRQRVALRHPERAAVAGAGAIRLQRRGPAPCSPPPNESTGPSTPSCK